MNKEELIKKLEDAKYWEDEFILKYDNPSFWALLKTLPEKKFDEVERLMQINLRDTRKHKMMTEKLIEDLKNGRRKP